MGIGAGYYVLALPTYLPLHRTEFDIVKIFIITRTFPFLYDLLCDLL